MPRSTAAMIGSTCRCSSVAMMAQVTSGRLSSSTWLCVTKSAPIFGATSPARFGFFSASPIHFTAGWRFATSPRNSPTRPPPMIASPMSAACVLMLSHRRVVARPILRLEVRDGRDRLVGQRQIDRLVAVGGQVGGRVGLHHHARAFRRHHHRLVLDAGFEEMDRLRPHAAGEHVVDLLARHGRHREHLAGLLGVEPVVALGVVENERAVGAGDLDPGRAVVRIALREIPAAADHHHHAVVHRHGGEHHVVRAVDRLHVAVGALRIDAHRLGGLQQPHHEVEVVRRFHHHRRQPHAACDLLAERRATDAG